MPPSSELRLEVLRPEALACARYAVERAVAGLFLIPGDAEPSPRSGCSRTAWATTLRQRSSAWRQRFEQKA
jgi:hypothetical protein